MKNHRNRKKIYSLLLLALVLLFGFTQISNAATTSEIENVAEEFMCNCGCNKVLPACDMVCGKNLKKVISKKLDAGWSKKKIMDYMINNYSEQILSVPTKKGFNLLAWVSPFVILVVGAIIAIYIIRSWAAKGEASMENKEERKNDEEQSKEKIELSKQDKEYRDKLEEELRYFDY